MSGMDYGSSLWIEKSVYAPVYVAQERHADSAATPYGHCSGGHEHVKTASSGPRDNLENMRGGLLRGL